MDTSTNNTRFANSGCVEAQTANTPTAIQVIWSHCAANCGGRCALRFEVEDGRAVGVGSCPASAPDGTPLPQACVRERRMLAWAQSPLRLKWPLKRTGPR